MKPLHGGRTEDWQIQYHLGRNDAPEFDKGQPGRIDLARFLVEKILWKDLRRRPLKIVELGCGAGDISGPYGEGWPYITPRGAIDTTGIEVHGYDVVPIAEQKCHERWPHMQFHLGKVEEQEPQDCDILIMCEFLEHVADPIRIAREWMPRARWAIIGHPLNEPDPPYEFGHCWSYTEEDWLNWFSFGPMPVWEKFVFPMGYFETMIMGHGGNPDL